MNGLMDTSLLGSFVSYTCVFINVLNWGCEKGVEELAAWEQEEGKWESSKSHGKK